MWYGDATQQTPGDVVKWKLQLYCTKSIFFWTEYIVELLQENVWLLLLSMTGMLQSCISVYSEDLRNQWRVLALEHLYEEI